jgi:hypothetical protein
MDQIFSDKKDPTKIISFEPKKFPTLSIIPAQELIKKQEIYSFFPRQHGTSYL